MRRNLVKYIRELLLKLSFLVPALYLAFLVQTAVAFYLIGEGLMFIAIYIGAIVILLLFSIRVLYTKLINLLGSTIEYIPIGIFLGLMFLISLVYEIFAFFENTLPYIFILLEFL